MQRVRHRHRQYGLETIARQRRLGDRLISRRALIAGLCALALPLPSFAQQPGRVARIGFLGLPRAEDWTPKTEALKAGLREMGYVEGRNLQIEFRWGEGRAEGVSTLAGELVQWKPDVLVSHSTIGINALRKATTTLPIVIAATGDAVASGFVNSLAQPGGNITGSTFFSPELTAKRLELVKEFFPTRRKVALLFNKNQVRPGGATLSGAQRAAQRLALELVEAPVTALDELNAVLDALMKQRIRTIFVAEDPTLVGAVGMIVEKARMRRMVTIGFLELADAGGVLAYGADIAAMHRRAAYFIDRILRGAKPADIPVEQASKFELVVNVRAARALGLRLPGQLIARADRVIE